MSFRFARRAAMIAALFSSSAALADTLMSIAGYGAPNTSTSVLGINDGGFMTGTVSYLNPDGTPTNMGDGFIRAPDGTYILFSHGDFTQGRAIRNDNTIVGYSNPVFGTGLQSREFVRDPSGGLSTLTNPTTGQELAGIAQGINASGAIVGNFRTLVGMGPQQRNHGFILDGSSFTELSYPGQPNFQISARGITDSGTVVGFVGSTGEAFILDGGAYSFYNHPLGVNGTVFEAITNANMILGMYTGADNNSHAFRFDATTNTYTDINVPGAINVQAFGVNQMNQFALTSDIGNFIYTIGGPSAPDGSSVFLPTDDGSGPGAVASFDFGVKPGQTYYIDPSFARGFEYLSGNNVDFASVTLPVGIAPGDIYTLQLWNGSAYTTAGTIQGGVVYNFSGAVDRFRIYGIPDGVVDPVNHSGFITGLTFDGSGQFNGQQISLVPEPAQWALLIGGFGFVGAAARRRKDRLAIA